MKFLFTIFCFCLFLLPAWSQTNCGPRYDQLIKEANEAFFTKKNYREAYEKYQAAQGCKFADLAYIDQQMDACLDGIDQQRLDAQVKEKQAFEAKLAALRAIAREVVAKRDLEKALADAKKLQADAEKAREEADSLRQEVQEKLEELKSANSEKIASMLIKANRNFQRMDYDSTFLNCQEINAIPGGSEATSRMLWETAVFYSESNQLQKAVDAMSLAGINIAKGSKRDIVNALRSRNPALYDSLVADQYPVMIPVAGGYLLRGGDMGRDLQEGRIPLEYKPVQNFSISETEVTNKQYALFAYQTGKPIPRGEEFLSNAPVGSLTWVDAMEYLNWLSLQMGKTPVYELKDSVNTQDPSKIDTLILVKIDRKANGYRLPNMAEWEYAARGGQFMEQWKCAGSDTASLVAWHSGNSKSPQPVASLLPNALGLYDMNGNAGEWCIESFNDLTEVEKEASYKINRTHIESDHPTQVRAVMGRDYKYGETDNVLALFFWHGRKTSMNSNRFLGIRVASSEFNPPLASKK